MITQEKVSDFSKYSYETTFEGYPTELLKSVETLNKMGIISTVFEFQFKTINELQIFTRILNRQEDEQRIANELKVTYFHNGHNKIKRINMVKNEQFYSMKKIHFNSVYHVTIFLKYYQDRIKQLQNQYRYTIINGREGYLYIYIHQDENISSMFLNQIRDMKRKFNYLQIKDQELRQKFYYSFVMSEKLKKNQLYYEIWYRGKQSTIIFYSETQNPSKIKQLILKVSRNHTTILKMTDQRLPFLINFLMFKLLMRLFFLQAINLDSVDINQVQINYNSLGIVLHDMHQVFSQQIKTQILQKMKNFILISYRSKRSQEYFNQLRKNNNFNQNVYFIYSKKIVCICFDVNKINSFDQIIKIFNIIGQSINYASIITLNWFHLQDQSLEIYRQQLAKRLISAISSSGFYIQNYERLILNQDLKCVLKLKNINLDNCQLIKYISSTITELVLLWNKQKNYLIKNKQVEQPSPENQQKLQENLIYIGIEEEISDSQQSQYEEGLFEFIKDNSKKENLTDLPSKFKKTIGFSQQNNFTQNLIKYLLQVQTKYFESKLNNKNQTEWRVTKFFRKFEQELLAETKIFTRIKKLQFNLTLKKKLEENLQKLRKNISSTCLFFHSFDSYSPNMFESPFYNKQLEDTVSSFQQFKVGQKFIICCEKLQDQMTISYPLCSLQVLKKF